MSTQSGKRSSRPCLSCQVSRFKLLTKSESKGRVMHLLKESTKPVPKQSKRRKVEALEVSDQIVTMPVIPAPSRIVM